MKVNSYNLGGCKMSLASEILYSYSQNLPKWGILMVKESERKIY